MARGRMVNQTIAEDVEFNSLSLEAQLVYLRTIPHLDRDGLINGHPSVLWGKIAPLMPDLLGMMTAIIDEMVSAGLVVRFIHNKTQILFFKGFTKNQIGMRYEREPASIFPIPPGYKRTNEGLTLIIDAPNNDNPPTPPTISDQPKQPLPPTNGAVPHDENEHDLLVAQTSGNLPADIRQVSGSLPPEENRIEENRIEENRREENAGAMPSFPAENGFSPPLLPQHRNSEQSKTAEQVKAAKDLGLSAEQFRLNADALLDGFGKTALADAGDDIVLNHTRELVLTMARMNERFKTVEGLESVFESWKTNDYRGETTPSSTQYKEHASLMLAGKSKQKTTESTPEKQLPAHKRVKRLN